MTRTELLKTALPLPVRVVPEIAEEAPAVSETCVERTDAWTIDELPEEELLWLGRS